jgi:hypothetical protein
LSPRVEALRCLKKESYSSYQSFIKAAFTGPLELSAELTKMLVEEAPSSGLLDLIAKSVCDA